MLETKVEKPDLVIYLKASTETIMKRIEMRDRSFERKMDISYIEELSVAYEKFFSNYKKGLLEVDADTIDFVKNEKDFDFIVSKMVKSGVEF